MIYRIRLASIMKILPNKRFFSPQYRNLFGQDFPAALFEIRAQELEIYEISRPNRMFLLAFFFETRNHVSNTLTEQNLCVTGLSKKSSIVQTNAKAAYTVGVQPTSQRRSHSE